MRRYSKTGSRAALDDWAAISEHQQGASTPWGHLQLLPRCLSTRGIQRGWPHGVLQFILAVALPILGIPLLPVRGSQGQGSLFSNSSVSVPSIGVLSPQARETVPPSRPLQKGGQDVHGQAEWPHCCLGSDPPAGAMLHPLALALMG